MSRFGYLDDGEGVPWEIWQQSVSRALGGRRGQEALEALEEALLGLPEPKLVESHLAADGGVCAIGALVAHSRARAQDVDIATVVEAMNADLACACGHSRTSHADDGCTGTHRNFHTKEERPCTCTGFMLEHEDAHDTVGEGQKIGLKFTVAWHLAYLNDEQYGGATPEERYALMLAWVRRALGREPTEVVH